MEIKQRKLLVLPFPVDKDTLGTLYLPEKLTKGEYKRLKTFLDVIYWEVGDE